MKKKALILSVLMVAVSGCSSKTKPNPVTKPSIIKETKIIKQNYIFGVDKKTKIATAILIQKINDLEQKNNVIEKRLLKQLFVINQLKNKKSVPVTIKPSKKECSFSRKSDNTPVIGKYKVKTFAVNIRKYPKVQNSKVISCLYKNNIVDIVEIKKDWGRISENKWIYLGALTKIDTNTTNKKR